MTTFLTPDGIVEVGADGLLFPGGIIYGADEGTSATVEVATAAFSLAANLPVFGTGTSAEVATAAFGFAASLPAFGVGASFSVPSAAFALSSSLPAFGVGVSFSPPAASFALTAPLPSFVAAVGFTAGYTFALEGFLPVFEADLAVNVGPGNFAFTVPGLLIGTGTRVDLPSAAFGLDAELLLLGTGASFVAGQADFAFSSFLPEIGKVPENSFVLGAAEFAFLFPVPSSQALLEGPAITALWMDDIGVELRLL